MGRPVPAIRLRARHQRAATSTSPVTSDSAGNCRSTSPMSVARGGGTALALLVPGSAWTVTAPQTPLGGTIVANVIAASKSWLTSREKALSALFHHGAAARVV